MQSKFIHRYFSVKIEYIIKRAKLLKPLFKTLYSHSQDGAVEFYIEFILIIFALSWASYLNCRLCPFFYIYQVQVLLRFLILLQCWKLQLQLVQNHYHFYILRGNFLFIADFSRILFFYYFACNIHFIKNVVPCEERYHKLEFSNCIFASAQELLADN